MTPSSKAVELRNAVIRAARDYEAIRGEERAPSCSAGIHAAGSALDSYIADLERDRDALAERMKVLERLEEAASPIFIWLNTGDGRAAQHRDAALEGHFKKWRTEYQRFDALAGREGKDGAGDGT